MASSAPAPGHPTGARPADAAENPEDHDDPGDQEDQEEIDGLLSPLLPRERGFVLGLLLSRGAQEQREETARVVSGPPGDRCVDAIRQANALSREGRLSLIRRLAGEVLGTGTEGLDVFAFPDGRLAEALARESTEILRIMATPATPATPTSSTPDSLTLSATRELERRHLGLPPSTSTVATRDDLIELRRALLARLQAGPAAPGAEAAAAPQPPPGAPPGPRRRRPPDPNL